MHIIDTKFFQLCKNPFMRRLFIFGSLDTAPKDIAVTA